MIEIKDEGLALQEGGRDLATRLAAIICGRPEKAFATVAGWQIGAANNWCLSRTEFGRWRLSCRYQDPVLATSLAYVVTRLAGVPAWPEDKDRTCPVCGLPRAADNEWMAEDGGVPQDPEPDDRSVPSDQRCWCNQGGRCVCLTGDMTAPVCCRPAWGAK